MRLFKRLLPWGLCALTTIAAVVFALLWLQLRAQEQERSEVKGVAHEFSMALTNFSADTIEADAQRIKSYAVGGFAEEADQAFGDDQIAAIKEARGRTEGEVDSVFVESIDEDSAEVFAVVTQTVTNTSLPEERTEVVRMELGMVKTTSGWKVDRVDVLQSPTSPLGAGG